MEMDFSAERLGTSRSKVSTVNSPENWESLDSDGESAPQGVRPLVSQFEWLGGKVRRRPFEQLCRQGCDALWACSRVLTCGGASGFLGRWCKRGTQGEGTSLSAHGCGS